MPIGSSTVFDVHNPTIFDQYGDHDIPREVQRELWEFARAKKVGYLYLCAIYRKGVTDTKEKYGKEDN